jgi:hypothetical protein
MNNYVIKINQCRPGMRAIGDIDNAESYVEREFAKKK